MKHTTQSDHNMNFDGMESIAMKQGSKFRGNKHAGVQDPNKTFNMGRGPTKGNHGTQTADASCRPPTSAVPTLPAQGSVRDNINRGAQVRTPGGVKQMPALGQVKFDCGRGPTKGNQC